MKIPSRGESKAIQNESEEYEKYTVVVGRYMTSVVYERESSPVM
jgi:hypothetical protein